jgi:hypothetical protein
MSTEEKLCADLERVLGEAVRARLESAALYVVRPHGETRLLRIEGSIGNIFAGAFVAPESVREVAAGRAPDVRQRIVQGIVFGLVGNEEGEAPDLAKQAAPEAVDPGRRVNEIMLKLLDRIEKLVDETGMDHIGLYEALCRAEAARRG